jgi:amino acid transporter
LARFKKISLGFDASAHMTEETHNAAMSGSIGIVMSIGVSAILGWFLILGLLFSIQDYDNTVASPTGEPVTQIFLDTVGQNGAIVLMVRLSYRVFFLQSNTNRRFRHTGHHHRRDVLLRVKPPAFFFCISKHSPAARRSTFSVTSNSRMMYAFSRDGAIPGSRFFHKVDRRWRSPIRTGTRSLSIEWVKPSTT